MSPPETTPMDYSLPKPVLERFPLSPPVSPATKLASTTDEVSSTVRDPILFEQTSPHAQPLFDDENRRLVEEHIAARKAEAFRAASPPRSSEYQLVLEFKSQVAQRFNANRKAWRLREMAQLRQDDALRVVRRYPIIAPAKVRPVVKPKVAVGVVKRVKPPKPVVRSDTPDRKVAREDKEFELLPDYCPPLSSLPSKPNSLKVDWKGAPIDLRFDPHAHLLHPDELLLAGNLRLDCATYLTSKRRIFIKRKECLEIGKEFRKTDAQQACKIDVNKASKLWAVFEKVGWLNPKWVAQFTD
jgi:hypothetical protein